MPDVYADQVAIHMGPFGCAINFSLSNAVPPPPGGAIQGEIVSTVRMSHEHLKVMVFLLRRQMLEFEGRTGVRVPIPQQVLNQLRIGREDWDACWRAGHDPNH